VANHEEVKRLDLKGEEGVGSCEAYMDCRRQCAVEVF